MKNTAQGTFEIALNVAGILTAINDETMEKKGVNKYNVHKFIGLVKAGKLSVKELERMEEILKKELLEHLGMETPEDLLAQALKDLAKSVGVDLDEEDEELEDETECECSNCPAKDICQDSDEEEVEDEEDESNCDDEDEARAEEFVNLVKKMAKEQGFVLAEIGLGVPANK